MDKKYYEINKNIINKIKDKTILDAELKELINEIKRWAKKNKATHYTHWFHPLRDTTAEKHENIEDLNANVFLKQEPDASSFPSGGIRSTFESRGYTIWDPSSPVFILNETLCIPTIFVSYDGNSLDYKTPLLKSIDLINKSAKKICEIFDDFQTKNIIPTLGIEQEFFIVDMEIYKKRPDLILAGRTLFGHPSAKDQQLSNNYFGSIPSRVLNFLKELETKSKELGIPIKTRHNEVAPGQFEVAPFFEESNIAIDHNQLFMYLLKIVGEKHNLKILLHEKPYKGVNGSGKHNNWSLQTDSGENLLNPSSENKLKFLTFLVNIIKAISEYPELLKASITTPENENRLGVHEAPPSIISIFVGDYISNILDKIENGEDIFEDDNLNKISLPNVPDVIIDNTDRNRTSPFAFTGNKFEFRSPGSSINSSKPVTVLNLIISNQFNNFFIDFQKESPLDDNNKKILNILKRYIKESKHIIYNGDNYSDEWLIEAKKRGLSDNSSTPKVIESYISEKSINLYEKNEILTKKEILSRYEIKLEKYIKKIQIESRLINELALSHIIPPCVKYKNIIDKNMASYGYDPDSYYSFMSKEIQKRIDNIFKNINEMTEHRKTANNLKLVESAKYYSENVYPLFNKIRYDVDKLETIIDDDLWKLPKYRELMTL